ncbi:MAG: heme lyase CcmF/NrfE family subunit [Betaproteobacteria bacterium]|jgi:cytochrome c-type biogenesis protein CcmF|nr:heme lyase CcmF/NrfE family subunit [Rhodocyclaceae bacterium]MCA3141821.1 heme lyase CcmF/NrfE family subunit [Rhodocyclaceae bacterium]MCA3144729.1 heme lyase CcmF/NrfE family subunit [Rhodocyclaceae bacterium]MCE2896691.1 heme lyase CcmF/NrfE family subunit [Betaproteobacteria bacterium]
MIPELGHFALIVALFIALVQGVVPLVGAARGEPRLMALARPAAQAQFLCVALAFGCLAWSFVNNDFSVLNVAANSNSTLPAQYRFAATWGSHEGSMLLWVLMLTGWMTAVSLGSRHLPEAMAARILAVMALISVGFLAFMLVTSNPFERLLPMADDGRDLNPLLQDPGMVIHPPMLYMGYVGFSVCFAFAVAALMGGQLDATWARWSRPWTTAAWMFLTIGICLGSAWAYYELGWGGWWFWDPVENASFMPWLVGTALMHSLAVTEKRGGFKIWTVLLAILAFSMSLLGTFLVRSGVLTSVHAFATDPKRGIFILGFLAVVVGGSLALFAWRAPRVGLGGRFELVSRESALLTNNVLLLTAAGSVMLGTLYPLFLDALDLGKISVGPPYFELVFVPLMAPALFLMGVGPVARWKKADLPDLAARLRWAAAAAMAGALAVPFFMGRFSLLVFLGLVLAFWILATTVVNVRERVAQLKAAAGLGTGRALAAQPRGYWGMLLAHCGVAVFVIGVTLVRGYETEKDVKMKPGDVVEVGGYGFRLEGFSRRDGPNFESTVGTLTVLENGREKFALRPEKRLYHVTGMPMTEADMDSGLTRDLYVSLGEPVGDGAWVVRVYHKPFIDWIWGGCFMMALGGLLALTDRRYRAARREAAALRAAAAAAAA